MPRCAIRNHFDVLHAQRTARQFACDLGFGRKACVELAIVASELSSNIVRHGKGGELEISSIDEAGGKAIVLVAHDSGPSFRDFKVALQDGCDDRGPLSPDELQKRHGLATGLGTVVRLTHALRMESDARGKRVIAVRYVKRPLAAIAK
jgi:anti-sigma regulatory factor (Ser/Thr protein kinase)